MYRRLRERIIIKMTSNICWYLIGFPNFTQKLPLEHISFKLYVLCKIILTYKFYITTFMQIIGDTINDVSKNVGGEGPPCATLYIKRKRR